MNLVDCAAACCMDNMRRNSKTKRVSPVRSRRESPTAGGVGSAETSRLATGELICQIYPRSTRTQWKFWVNLDNYWYLQSGLPFPRRTFQGQTLGCMMGNLGR